MQTANWNPTLILTIAAVLTLAGPSPGAAQSTSTFHWEDDIPAGAGLRVHTVAGEINVVASPDGTARVSGRAAEPRRGGTGDPAIRFDMVRTGRDVTICASRPTGSCAAEGIRSGGRGSDETGSADFTLEVPAGVALRVGSGNGRIRITGVTAAVHASTGNGRVSVDAQASEVTITSGNGRVEVRGARGPVEASTGNGAVLVTTARGPVSASTGNGRIEARIASLPSAAGEMSFRSGSGRILLVLPEDFSGEVRGSTGNGRLESRFPVRSTERARSGRFSTVIGDGGWQIRAATGNGSVELRRHRASGTAGGPDPESTFADQLDPRRE